MTTSFLDMAALLTRLHRALLRKLIPADLDGMHLFPADGLSPEDLRAAWVAR